MRRMGDECCPGKCGERLGHVATDSIASWVLENLEAAVEHRVDARRTSESNHGLRLVEGNIHPQEVRDGLLP
jgi:hypothetical protein